MTDNKIWPSGWRKSSRCESSMCAEVAPGDGVVGMRNNTVPDQHIVFPASAWEAFIAAVKAGEFDADA